MIVHDVPDVPDVPTLGGVGTTQTPGSIYAPTTTTPQQGPFGGTANGPFASSAPTTTPAPTTTSTAQAGPVGAVDSTNRSTFAKSVAPYAQYAAQQLGIDPTWVAAMMGSESNFGNAPGNELFGVKALPGQPHTTLSTHEGEYGGTTQNADFAAYDTPKDSVDAWINLIKNHYPERGQRSGSADVRPRAEGGRLLHRGRTRVPGHRLEHQGPVGQRRPERSAGWRAGRANGSEPDYGAVTDTDSAAAGGAAADGDEPEPVRR